MKKTIEQWERQYGCMILNLGDHVPTDELDEGEFGDLRGPSQSNARGVDFETRERWLTDNDYPITRANLMNADLRPKRQEPLPPQGDES